AYLFRGALLAVQPLLGHHPGYGNAIDISLARAREKRSMDSQAWRLYECVADLEELLGPKMPLPGAGGKPLWVRLGGEKVVRKIIGEFVDDILRDQGVNFSRDGKYEMTPGRIDHVKQMMVELASDAMGGPLRYTGKPMALVHDGMNIKDEEFTTCVS